MDQQVAGRQVQPPSDSAGGARILDPVELLAHPVPVELELRHGGRLDERGQVVEQILGVDVVGDEPLRPQARPVTFARLPVWAIRRIRPMAGGRPSGKLGDQAEVDDAEPAVSRP